MELKTEQVFYKFHFYYSLYSFESQQRRCEKMKLQTLKNNKMTCSEYINLLINKGYKTVAEAIENEK